MLIGLCFDQFFGHIQNFLKTQVSGRYTAFTQVCLSSIRNAALTQLKIKAVFLQLLRSFDGSCRNAAFTQLSFEAAETQLLRSFLIKAAEKLR